MRKFPFLNLCKKYASSYDSLSVPSKMKAVLQNKTGNSSTLYIGQTDTPVRIFWNNLRQQTNAKF